MFLIKIPQGLLISFSQRFLPLGETCAPMNILDGHKKGIVQKPVPIVLTKGKKILILFVHSVIGLFQEGITAVVEPFIIDPVLLYLRQFPKFFLCQ